MRLKPLLPVLALLVLAAACSRQEPQPSPPATAPAAQEPVSAAQPEAVAITPDMGGPTSEPAANASPIASVRQPSASEQDRIRSDATGLAAVVACKLLPQERVDGYAGTRRQELLDAGVDAAAYDAVYRPAFDNLISKFPQTAADKQEQVCTLAKVFETSVRDAERSVADQS